MVQCECVDVRVAIVGADLGGRGCPIAGAKGIQQLFRLPFELLEVRVLAAGGEWQESFTMSSFPG